VAFGDWAEVPVRRLRVNPDSSTIVVEARSNVGPIAWEAVGPTGEFRVALSDGGAATDPPPQGWLELRLDALTSGNRAYDAELQRRLDTRRHPVARVELREVRRAGNAHRFHVVALLWLHGVEREVDGEIEVEVRADESVLVTGQQQIDIRDFGLPAPSTLMLKVYPDVQVHLVVQGEPID
jgi:hypothetical protein